MSSDKLKIEVWGKVGDGWPVDGKVSTLNGKGKERERDIAEDGGENDSGWKVLDQWDVDLADLIPLPEDVSIDKPLIGQIIDVQISSTSARATAFKYSCHDALTTWPSILSAVSFWWDPCSPHA